MIERREGRDELETAIEFGKSNYMIEGLGPDLKTVSKCDY